MAENINSSDFSDRDKSMMSLEKSKDKDDDDSETPKKRRSREAVPLFEKSKDDQKAEKNQRDENKEQTKEQREAKEAKEIKEDELAEDEEHMAVEQYAESRVEDLKEDLEVAEPDSVEEAVALADAALIETINENQAADPEAFDAALAQTIEELGLGEEISKESSETEPAEVEADIETSGENEAEDDEDDPSVVISPAASSTVAGTAVPPPPVPVTPVPPPPPVMPPGPPGGGAGTPPPRGRGPAGAPIGAGGAGMPPLGPPSPSTLAAPGTAASVESWRPNRRRRDLLVGGLIGYMIGRRGGRKRAEAELLPIQAKLEQKVNTLHDQIAEREARIRKLAAEKVMNQPEAARQQIIERLESRQERKQEKQAGTRPLPERQIVRPEQEARPERPPVKRAEVLGRVLLPKTETVSVIPVEAAAKSTETMTLFELLNIADKIERDGISVKQMYENNRLDALGLRRVVHEFLQGRRFEHVLEENLKTVESMERLSPASAPGQPGSDYGGGRAVYRGAQPPVYDQDHPQRSGLNPADHRNKVDSPMSVIAQNKSIAVASGITFVAVLILLIILFT